MPRVTYLSNYLMSYLEKISYLDGQDVEDLISDVLTNYINKTLVKKEKKRRPLLLLSGPTPTTYSTSPVCSLAPVASPVITYPSKKPPKFSGAKIDQFILNDKFILNGFVVSWVDVLTLLIRKYISTGRKDITKLMKGSVKKGRTKLFNWKYIKDLKLSIKIRKGDSVYEDILKIASILDSDFKIEFHWPSSSRKKFAGQKGVVHYYPQ